MAIAATSRFYALYRFNVDLGNDVNPLPEPVITINPSSILLSEDGESKNIAVTITYQPDASYSIIGLPSWLIVSNKTQTGFTLSATATPNEENRSVTLVVKLDNYTSQALLTVTQGGQWLSEFVFMVKTNNPNTTIPLIACLGTLSGIGEAQVDYGDGSPLDHVPIDQSVVENALDPATGGTMPVVYGGTDISHNYINAGEYEVHIKTRNMVTFFKFNRVPLNAGDGWYNSLTSNDFVTEIIKIQSDNITNGIRMFSGVRFGWFAPNFKLDCPNIERFDYFMEYFGTKGNFWYDFSANDRLRLPVSFYSKCIKKHLIATSTRTYYGSGFEAIEAHMLSFSTALTSTIEVFSRMMNVGAHWTTKYNATAISSLDNVGNVIVEEFVDTTIFHAHPNISDFTGAFHFINDHYGEYLDSGYSYFWMLKADIFKYNTANNLNLTRMFKQCNRTVLEVDFFKHIGQRIKRMDACFWGGFNLGANPRIWSMLWLAEWIMQNQYDFRGCNDLNSLFPDSEYLNLVSAVAAFGFRGDKREVCNGLQCLNRPEGQLFDTADEYNLFTNFTPRLKLHDVDGFLAKFPNCNETSGYIPNTNTQPGTVDGWAYNFWDFDKVDMNGVSKVSDLSNNSRPTIKLEANMYDW